MIERCELGRKGLNRQSPFGALEMGTTLEEVSV